MTKMRILCSLVLCCLAATAAHAQDDDDKVLKLAEPDFTLISSRPRSGCPNTGARFA